MINTLLLQLGDGGFDIRNLMLPLGMVVVFYFFFIRPQQKKQKDQKNFWNEIKKGDSIVTMGGIHGKVSSVDDKLVTLEVDKGSKFVVEKSSISLEITKRAYGSEEKK